MKVSPHLVSVLKIAVATFAGAFLAALVLTGPLPTTWAAAKADLVPALFAGIVAEVLYLRSQITGFLTGTIGAACVGAATLWWNRIVARLAGAAFLALCFVGCLPSGAPTPQTVADLKAAESDVLEALPVACTIADILDPTGATVVCAILDADGAALSTVTKALPSPAIAAAVVAAHPAAPVVAKSLKARFGTKVP